MVAIKLPDDSSFGANLHIIRAENNSEKTFSEIVENIKISISRQVPNYPGSEKKVMKLMIKESFGLHSSKLIDSQPELKQIFDNPELLLTSEMISNEAKRTVKEAIIELIMDVIVGKDADERAKYGIATAISRVDLLDRSTELNLVVEDILKSTQAKYVIAAGGIEMAKLMGLDDFLMIDMSSTDGQSSTQGSMSVNSRSRIIEQISTHAEMPVVLIDDVIDTGATLVAAIIQIVSAKKDLGIEGLDVLLAQAVELNKQIVELNSKMKSTSRDKFLKDAAGQYPDLELITKLSNERRAIQVSMVKFLHAAKQPPVSIYVMTAADKMIGTNMELYGVGESPIYTLAPEFANGSNGEMLEMWELSWLMGVGLDTEMSLHLKNDNNWEKLKVSLGRKWGDIVRLDDQVEGMLPSFRLVPGYRRLQAMLVVAMEFLGVKNVEGFVIDREG